MSRYDVLDHPDVAAALRTGYPTFTRCGPEELEETQPKYDEATVDAVFETFSNILKDYLSEKLCAEVWNKASRVFPGC